MPLKTGAVIVAAGLSSRMDAFKPMLKIGSITIAQRVILTLKQAGVDLIVVVTGKNAEQLEKHLVHMDVVCLRNERYAETQMFDSAGIGLEYIKERCDRVLFTPVDVPLVKAGTIKTMLSDESPLCVPVHGGKEGHPLMLSSRLIPRILEYRGDGGLAQAIKNCGCEKRLIRVDDEGVLLDIDTREDYNELLSFHNGQLFRLQAQFKLAREMPFFGPGTATLLSMVKQTGSVKTACQMMRLSNSKGWRMINLAEQQLGYPVVHRYHGGRNGGRACLTEDGDKLLEKYGQFVNEALAAVQDTFDRIFGA